MKTDYITRAKKFIKDIYPYIMNIRTSPFQYIRAIETFNAIHSRKVEVAHGVSRIALITSDYVVKIEYNEEEVTRVGGCESEMAFYEFAQSQGFEYLFAKITLFEYNGRKFYIMPRVQGIGRFEYSYAEDVTTGTESSFLRSYLYDLHDENYGWYNGHVVIIDYACNVFQQGEAHYSEYT